MDQERHRRVLEVFRAVYERPTTEWEGLLDRHCGEDPGLHAEVQEMLRLHARTGTFLDTPALGDGFRIPREAAPADPGEGLVGHRVGDFTLRAVIASGGMGTVYLAEQEHPQRRVAVKVLRRGLATPRALRRFEFEVQVLARLQHPNIAQIIEAGTWEAQGPDAPGLPYFVMEYIPGARPITRYVREEDLGTTARLALFLDVCRAVHHGHQKGVIHRDLKPDNVLVDDQGRPKVIDFGLARLSDTEATLTTMLTTDHQILGTLQYMSPEQCRSDLRDIDTRSDVYSLGVLLHELLCDHPPYDLSRLAVLQALEVIQRQAPIQNAHTKRILRGDLDTITHKALEKDREQRYASVADLGQDLQRFLDHEPIQARPPSAMYQLRKFARRNRALVGGAIAVVLALVAGLAGTSWQAHRADQAWAKEQDARKDAERDAAVKGATYEFVHQMLTGFEPGEQDMDVREMVDRAAARIAGSFPDEPLVEADIQDMLHWMYRRFGEPERAAVFAEDALELLRRELGPDDDRTLEVQVGLAWCLGDAPDATPAQRNRGEALAQEALEYYRQRLGPTDLRTLESEVLVARIHERLGRCEEAEARLRRVIPLIEQTGASESLSRAWNNLGLVLEEDEDAQEGVECFQKAVATTRGLAPPNPGLLASQLLNLGRRLRDLDRLPEAEQVLRESLGLAVRVFGHDHVRSLDTLEALCWTLEAQGKNADSVTQYEGFLKVHREEHPEAFHTLGTSLHHYANVLASLGRWTPAKRPALEALEAYRIARDVKPKELLHAIQGAYQILVSLGEDPGDRVEFLRTSLAEVHRRAGAESGEHAAVQAMLGVDLANNGRTGPAIDLLLDYLERVPTEPLLQEEGPLVIAARRSILVEAMVKEERFESAEEQLLLAEEGFGDLGAEALEFVPMNHQRLVRLYEAWGFPDLAEEWRDPEP